jgi:hypothetical protein
MYFKISGIVGAIAILLSSSVAIAEDAQRYITVGHDNSGNSIALDTKSIKGTTYKL